MNGMEKISAEQLLAVFGEAPTVIRKLASERDMALAERDEAKAKLAAYDRRDTVEKIANAMIEKGLDRGVSREELVSGLEALAEQGKLAEVQHAVDLVGPDMGQKIASVYQEGLPNYTVTEGGVGGHGGDLMNFIMGGV